MSRLFGRRQLSKSDEPIDSKAPRPELHALPSYEGVSTEDVPAVRLDKHPEVRRRDVGVQRYGSGVPATAPGHDWNQNYQRWREDMLHMWPSASTPGASYTQHDTPIGPIQLAAPHPRRDLGTAPTAATFDFLKHEYQGSRFNPPKPRFYS